MTAGDAVDPSTVQALATALPEAVPGTLGAYLHGSAGMGRLRQQSDVDVLVVSAAPLTGEERARLVELVLERSGRYPRARGAPRPIELTVVVHGEVRPWRHPSRCEFLYGEWMRSDVESGSVPAAFTCPDLALLIAMALTCRAPLLGPDPSQLLDPVPPADLLRATTSGVTDLLDALDRDTTNVLLTLARAWYTCSGRGVTTKDDAAGWAAVRTDGAVRRVLERARDAYLLGEPHLWGAVTADDRDAAHFLVGAIEDASTGTSGPPVRHRWR